jgi:nucleoside-diphosphate kinase
MEKSFVMIKPDGVERGLVGDIISRFERKGLKISAAKLVIPSEDTVKTHYQEHYEKDFYHELVDSINGKKVIVLVIEGENAIKLIRKMVGDKDPLCAAPGTLRGDFASETTRNLVHASDSPESSEREIEIWFGESTI